MGDYDITLKGLFQNGGHRFLEALGVRGEASRLNVDLPKVSERRVDLLLQTDEAWVHVEFQSRRDTTMMIRMLD